MAAPLCRVSRAPHPHNPLPPAAQSTPTRPTHAESSPGPLWQRADDGSHAFAATFRAAFQRLDRENRSPNLVRLLDLRRALAQFERPQFDAGLRQLRLDDE